MAVEPMAVHTITHVNTTFNLQGSIDIGGAAATGIAHDDVRLRGGFMRAWTTDDQASFIGKRSQPR